MTGSKQFLFLRWFEPFVADYARMKITKPLHAKVASHDVRRRKDANLPLYSVVHANANVIWGPKRHCGKPQHRRRAAGHGQT
jgi:hypothetical protein